MTAALKDWAHEEKGRNLPLARMIWNGMYKAKLEDFEAWASRRPTRASDLCMELNLRICGIVESWRGQWGGERCQPQACL